MLKIKDVRFVEDVPRWPEFSSKVLWEKAKSNPIFKPYFPDYTSSKRP